MSETSKNNSDLKQLATLNESSCLDSLHSRQQGLSEQEVEDRRSKYGRNIIQHEKSVPWYWQLLRAFITPFNGVLLFVGIISFVTDVTMAHKEDRDYKTIILLAVMILLSSIIRFWQEFKSNKAADELKRMITTSTSVSREGEATKEVHIEELVPGDIVNISAGDMIPADCRVLQSKDLFVSQSILSGESMPVEKRPSAIENVQKDSVIDLSNMAFMGTNANSGTATMVVVKTGDQTFLGSISKSLTQKTTETNFEKGVNSVSWLLIRFMLVMVPLVFLINGFTKGNWLEAFLFAITVAVGLTPEMLPMIVTTNLAKGAVNMSKQKVIVKQLDAIQNFGAMDILCTDKTGTLTMDKIVLQVHLNVMGDTDAEVLKWAYLNSYHQTGLKNLLDIAVLDHKEVNDMMKADEHYKKVDEIPFDFQRRRMSVILEKSDGRHLMICKGAIEEMLQACTQAFDPGPDRALHIENDTPIPLDGNMRTTVIDKCKKLNEDGMRVLLVAIREFDKQELTYSINDEKNMILTGFIGFLDPPKGSAKESIQVIQQNNVQVKVLTGDNEIVTKKICADVGIPSDIILLGPQIEGMNDDELQKQLEKANIMAKLSPLQKSRIIQLLKKNGHSVGFLGDGINDAPALRQADVGISVDTGADIAKESANIILLEKDLMVLNGGIIHGRTTFGNIIKYIKMTASSNFGNMFSVLGASAFLPFLPMMPVQILTQNLLYDFSQASIPWDRMDKEFLEQPQKWDTRGIARFMFWIGPISSVFDYITFGVLYFILKANSPEHQSLFQSGWFIEGLLSQTLIVHMIRTRKIPFIQSSASKPVIFLTALIMAVGLYLPFSPFAHVLKMQPLPAIYFLYLAGILISYCVLTQIVKGWYIRKFSQWL